MEKKDSNQSLVGVSVCAEEKLGSFKPSNKTHSSPLLRWIRRVHTLAQHKRKRKVNANEIQRESERKQTKRKKKEEATDGEE